MSHLWHFIPANKKAEPHGPAFLSLCIYLQSRICLLAVIRVSKKAYDDAIAQALKLC